jgi:hypothetical protein
VTGVADAAMFGPSLEFFVFRRCPKFDQTTHSAFYYVDSVEGEWNTGGTNDPTWGTRCLTSKGYFPCPPDAVHDLRSEMMRAMMDCGMTVESHHHEKASGGQCAINIRYDELVPMADNVLKYKYIVKNMLPGDMGRRPHSCPNRSSRIMAAGCTSTFRSGKTEGNDRRTCFTAATTRTSPMWPCTLSAGC